jgi:RNA-directed DNA polymerase
MSIDTLPSNKVYQPRKKSILELSHQEAHDFLLKTESYCTLDLPNYITFGNLLSDIDKAMQGKKLCSLSNSPRDHDDVNYTILNNKDGKYAWRPIQLIHPALYVSLVHQITTKENWKIVCDRFNIFFGNDRIKCFSMPLVSLTDEKDKAEQVSYWWSEVEQKSIILSMEYEYLLETDITDCYRAIYTHSIAWALHEKIYIKDKKNRNDKNLIGNVIDNHIQDMQYGQTNGIPQGSVLMDFIAEIILGYADFEISKKILKELEPINDYYIIRYRDDYRVFINNPKEGERIVKIITEVMIDLGLKLNPSKTKASNDVVHSSIKSDKLSWIARKQSDKSFQKHLLIIYDHAIKFPNSGSLTVALVKYYQRILKREYLLEKSQPLIAIIVDIAYRNPRAYPICASILSKLLSFIEEQDIKKELIDKIRKRFSQIPNTEYMQIWLQRVTKPFLKEVDYSDPICKLVSGHNEKIWNMDWIESSNLKKALNTSKIIDTDILNRIESIIPLREIELFISKSTNDYQ